MTRSTARFGPRPERIALHVGPAHDTLRGRLGTPALIYADPPFATGRSFDWVADVEADGTPMALRRTAFDDRVAELEAFAAFIDDLVAAAHDALAPEGSLLLHLDHRFAHRAAVCCDDRFGPGDRVQGPTRPGFRNELIWTYGLGGSSRRYWPRKHDTILWYTRGTRWVFHPPMVPATSNRLKGRMKKRPDVLDVPTLNNRSRERTGWPTQKPLALLEMLVEAHTDPDDLVVDPFCGSGTTPLAAARTGRRAAASDISEDAVGLTLRRLLLDGHGATVHGLSWREALPVGRPLTLASVGRVDASGFVARRTWVAPDRDGDGTWRGPTRQPPLPPPQKGEAWRARTVDGEHFGSDGWDGASAPWSTTIVG